MENDMCMVNDKLKLPKKYQTVPANIIKYFKLKEVNKLTINQEVSYDRVNTMKCHLVKIGKNNKTKLFTKDELYKLLVDNIKIFKIDQKDFNSVLDTIVKSYYFDIIDNKYKYQE